jgi:hypothetical protein
MNNLPDESILYADSSRGIYIPQYFAESVNRSAIVEGSKWINDLDELTKGPDECESYWDIWADILDNMTLHDNSSGIEYGLYQDGDLWLVPVDAQWESE